MRARRWRLPQRSRGLTLLELMVVVVIVALLAAIAFPSYQEQVRKSKRAEGKAALLKAAQLQERAYTASSTASAGYASDLAPLFGLAANAQVRSGEDPTRGNYNLSVELGPFPNFAEGFVVRATPNAERATGGGFSDPICGDLTLSSTGERRFTGTDPKATKDTCW